MSNNADDLRSNTPFKRFEDAVRESLTVSKSELNRRLAEARAERAKARAERNDKPSTPSPSGTALSDRA